MKILEKMKADMSQLWKQAANAKTPDVRSELMQKYQIIYSGYKKQVRFFEAMEDATQTNSQTSEQQI